MENIMQKSSPYLVAVTLDVPGAILDEATDSYIDCNGLTILGNFNATSPQHAIELSHSQLPSDLTESTKERLFFHVFELADTTD
jgi:hypothetical protein